MNELLNTKLELNSSLKNRNIRNCLAHYGLGQFMKETDIDKEDYLCRSGSFRQKRSR